MGLGAYLAVSGTLLVIGLCVCIARRNLLFVLMGIELILNAANLNVVAFSRFSGTPLEGQIFAVFVIILAAAEAAVALAIVLNLFGVFGSIRPDRPDELRA